jgi:hypothetical protein
LDFVKYNFTKSTYSTDNEGNVNEQIDTETFVIEVSKNWQEDGAGSVPKNGYIAKGLTKYAFKVSLLLFFLYIIQIISSRDVLREGTTRCFSVSQ